MADEYLIPFGIDSADFENSIAKMTGSIEKLESDVKTTTDGMSKGFTEAAGASDKLNNSIVINAEEVASLSAQAKELGKSFTAAMTDKTGDEMQKKLEKFGQLLSKFSKDTSKPLGLNIDTAKLEQFEQLLASGADELQVLTGVIEGAKVALSNLDPNTEEFAALNAQLKIAESFLEGVGETANKAAEKQKSLKGQLRDLKAALAEMEIAGKGNTQEFINLSKRAGELEDQIGDVSSRVKVLASDTKFLDAGIQAIQGLAGAFTAAQGAAALFGDENENVQKVIQKVTGAMAVLQGVQAVANALNKDSALSVLLFSNAQKKAIVTTEALTVAEVEQTVATEAATVATEGLTAAMLLNPVVLVLAAIAALVVAIIAFTDNSEKAKDATKQLNDELEAQNEILRLDEASLKRRTDLLVAEAKLRGATESEITQIEGEALATRINQRNQYIADLKEQQAKARNNELISAEELKKISDSIFKAEQENANDLNELEIKRIDKKIQLQKEEAEADKKRLEQKKRNAETEKKINDQQLKFTAELAKASADAIKNQYDKERANIQAGVDEKVAALKADTSLSAKAEETKQKLIEQLKKNGKSQIEEVDRKQAADLTALQLKAQQITIENREEGIVKEVETIRLGFVQKANEIKEAFKNETELRDSLLAQLNEEQIRQTKKAQDEFALKSLSLEAQRQELLIETAKQFLPDLPEVEEQKQIALLKVQKEWAQKQVDLLIEQGNAQDSLVVLQAKKTVNDLQKNLDQATAAQKAKGKDWFQILGINNLTDKQKQAVTDDVQKSLAAINSITSSIIDMYQMQVDAKQKVIDQENKEIDNLQSRLDKENQLREEGFANNSDLLQKELDAKKKQREEDLKQQQEIQKKQQAMRKAQLVLDTAVQVSNLVTASTEIYASLASAGPYGIALAIATIGLMIGSFVAAKVKAFQAVDKGAQFGEGGEIDGKSHKQGGVKYYSQDGKNIELEGGEYVVKKKSTAKYYDLIEAINNDDFSGMNEEALRSMLAGMGISYGIESPKKAIQIVNETTNLKAMIKPVENHSEEHLESIRDNVIFLAQKEKDRVERWQDENYYYEKTGSNIKKIRKNK